MKRFFELLAMIASGIATNVAQVKNLRSDFNTFTKRIITMSKILDDIKEAQARIVADIKSVADGQTKLAADQTRIAADIRVVATKMGAPGEITQADAEAISSGLTSAADALDAAAKTATETEASLSESADALDKLAAGSAAEPDRLVLRSMFPEGGKTGDVDFTLSLQGSGFTDSSVVRFRDTELATTFISDTELQAKVPAELVADFGGYIVLVHDGDKQSSALTFTVVNSNPTPGHF